MRTTYARRREQRRLGQLGVCVVLFAGVLVGRCVSPGSGLWAPGETRNEVSSYVSAFSEFGSSAFFEPQSAWEVFQNLVGTVFGGESQEQETAAVPGGNTLSYQAERRALTAGASASVWASHLGVSISSEPTEAVQEEIPEEEPQPVEQPVQDAESGEAAVQQEAVVQAVAQDYTVSGEALPASVSLQYYALGLSDTVVPVFGTISSEFGYRIHPIDGEYRFHYGLDIAADEGTAIGAYAAGVVEYIGESSEYGLYLQLDHGNNIKTFYAHCSKLLVSQGQTVSKAETVAEVGSTGVSTGPHLHLEVKKDGIRLNPIYYVNLS